MYAAGIRTVTNRSPARNGFSAAGTAACCCVAGVGAGLVAEADRGDDVAAPPTADPVEVAAHPARTKAVAAAMDAAVCLTAAV